MRRGNRRARIRVVIPDNVDVLVAEVPGMVQAMTTVARVVSQTAERSSPVDQGQYREHHEHGPYDGEPGAAYFGNNDTDAHLVEFGSINNVAHRTLQRAAESNGLRFEPKGRR